MTWSTLGKDGLTRVHSGAMDAQEDGAELTLLILPLKRSTIDGTADPECAAAPSIHHLGRA